MAFKDFSRSAVSKSSPTVDEAKLNRMIREMAYHIWERKGKPFGKDWENWLQAEKQIRARFK